MRHTNIFRTATRQSGTTIIPQSITKSISRTATRQSGHHPSPHHNLNTIWHLTQKTTYLTYHTILPFYIFSRHVKMNTQCICNDVARIIKCNWCGYELKARIRRICEKHPRIIHLVDIVVCPRCKCKFR